MKTKKHHKLGLFMLIALVVGNMVGSGIFLLPSSLATYGSISVFAWILTGIGAMAIALIFAHLGGVHPDLGGPYAYCRRGFGDFIGFQIAYTYWIYTWVGNAAIAASLVSYLSFFFPVLAQNHLYGFIAAVSLVWILTYINYRGVYEAGIVQLVTVIIKLWPLLIVAIGGLIYLHPQNFHQINITHHSMWYALAGSATLTLWALTGVESATIPAGEVERAKYNIPRATLIGTSIAVLLYILGTIAVMGVVPLHILARLDAPFATAAQMVFGSWGADIVAIAAIFSSLGALNGWILLQSQMPYAVAKDDLFPKIFAKESRFGTPVFGLIISSSLVTILLAMNFEKTLVDEFTFIILLATITILYVYWLTTMAYLMRLFKKQETFERSVFVKRLLVAVLAMVYIFWAFIGGGEQTVYYGTLLLLTSVPVYAIMKGLHAKQNNNGAKDVTCL